MVIKMKDKEKDDLIENKTTSFTADHIFTIQNRGGIEYGDEANHIYTTEISDEFNRAPIGVIIEKEQG